MMMGIINSFNRGRENAAKWTMLGVEDGENSARWKLEEAEDNKRSGGGGRTKHHTRGEEGM
jgi:hypothetical protein